MTMVSSLAAGGPAPGKAAGGHPAAVGTDDEFAALLAGLVSVVPTTAATAVAATLAARVTGETTTPDAPTSGLTAVPAQGDLPEGAVPGGPSTAAVPAPAAAPAGAAPVRPELLSAPAASTATAGAVGGATPATAPAVDTVAGPAAHALETASGLPIAPATGGAATGTTGTTPAPAGGSAEADPTPAAGQPVPARDSDAPDGDAQQGSAAGAAPVPRTEPSPTSAGGPTETAVAGMLNDSRPVSAPPATAPAAPAAPAAPPAAQVVAQLAPVLEGPDGSYTMSLQLYPEELGAVQVEVSLRSGEVSVALHAADEVAKELLRAALPQLRELLEASGLTAAQMSVDDGSEDSSHDEPGPHTGEGSRPTDDDDDSPAPAPAPDPDAALDVRM